MDRMTLIGILSAHAVAAGATAERAWTHATEAADRGRPVTSEADLQQACAEVYDRAHTEAWEPTAAV